MSDKTEEPTPKRLREARKKGQIPFSREVPSAVTFLAGMALVAIGAPRISAEFERLFRLVTSAAGSVDQGGASVWQEPLMQSGMAILTSVGMIVGGITLAGLGAALGQTGFMLTLEKITPSMSKMNPLQALQKWFSAETAIEFLKTLTKVALVFGIAYSVLSVRLHGIVSLHQVDLPNFYRILLDVGRAFAIQVGAAFVLVAGFDYFVQYRNWKKQLMMSKDEVKREYKEQEGDPIIKGQRKALHQELAMQQISLEVPLANAVVVNPTHLAVVLRYDRDKMAAPKVTAKGGGAVAKKILQLARKHDIPTIRDVPLAHALFAVEMGRTIPRDLFDAVAEVLLFARQIRDEGVSGIADAP
jgi:flagellar biosynthesis protein FlhB